MKDNNYQATIPEDESVALLKDGPNTGEDEGFGSFAAKQAPPKHPHRRETSSATVISWMSNISSFLKNGNNNSESEARRNRKKYQRAAKILFASPEYFKVGSCLVPVHVAYYCLANLLLFLSTVSDQRILGMLLHTGYSLCRTDFCWAIYSAFLCG